MTKNTMMPSVADFDAWTPEDEKKALEASAEQMKVKHLIKDGSVWFLAPHGHIYKLPIALSIDDFAKLDFRVCKVLKAEAVRKSNACLKLTLFDGIGERVIMSSIKAEYKPEDLIGRKIIVIANLKPSRICNVNSQGMLLAATNNACGCKVLFVDDAVPEGTPIH